MCQPAGDMVDRTQINPKVWKVSAICPSCDRMLTQRVGALRLAHFKSVTATSRGEAHAQLREASASSVNCDCNTKDLYS